MRPHQVGPWQGEAGKSLESQSVQARPGHPCPGANPNKRLPNAEPDILELVVVGSDMSQRKSKTCAFSIQLFPQLSRRSTIAIQET